MNDSYDFIQVIFNRNVDGTLHRITWRLGVNSTEGLCDYALHFIPRAFPRVNVESLLMQGRQAIKPYEKVNDTTQAYLALQSVINKATQM